MLPGRETILIAGESISPASFTRGTMHKVLAASNSLTI